MSLLFELSIEVSEQYDFNKEALSKIEDNTWVKNQWPLVYFIQNEAERIAYVGESTNASSRIKNHLANPKKSQVFNKISIIGSDKFNKSATELNLNCCFIIESMGSIFFPICEIFSLRVITSIVFSDMVS